MEELKKRTIEKEFVPYDLALELRNLGFDDYVFAFYWTDTKQLILDSPDYSGKHNGVHLQAPLWQQAFRFFREKYMLSGETYIFKNFWNFDIEDINNSIQLYTSDITSYSTYEEAELECLVKLIEIAKEQNMK